jgi:hypothetical protein
MKTFNSIQDEIIHRSAYGSQLTIDPAVKKLGIYLHYGVSGSYHFTGPVNIAFAMYLRNNLRDGLYFGCRAGLKTDI